MIELKLDVFPCVSFFYNILITRWEFIETIEIDSNIVESIFGVIN